MKNIFVLGSINYDLTMFADKLPQKGETAVAHGFIGNSGGKGANQAVAVGKLGGKVFLIGSAGNDIFGKQCLDVLKQYGVDTRFVGQSKTSTGTAMVLVQNGDNRILIDHGANFVLESDFVKKTVAENIREGDIFVTQMEIPAECAEAGLKIAKQKGAITVLNPAPASGVTEEMLRNTDIIVPNESEAEQICGIAPVDGKTLGAIDEYFSARGVKSVVVTLGSGGCYCKGKIYPPFAVDNVVDTTAAGDTFIGALCVRLAQGADVGDALNFCQAASALTISRKGAQIAIPYLEEVEKIVRATSATA